MKLKGENLIKSYLKGKDLESYVKLEQDCNTTNTTEEQETVTISVEDLEKAFGAIEEPFNSIGELLEKEMVYSRTLYISEEITLETINHIIMLIHKYNRDDGDLPVDERIPIVLYIDTQGGELYRGFSLIGAIENSITPVVGVVEGGICMSMGIPLFLSCHYRMASSHATFLYHELRAPMDVQTLREIQNIAKHYEILQDKMDLYIVNNSTMPSELLKEKRKLNLDWYMTIEEVEKYGFVHEIL